MRLKVETLIYLSRLHQLTTYYPTLKSEQSMMLVVVDKVLTMVKKITMLDTKRHTSTIPTQKASMATKLTKINDSRDLSKSIITFIKTYVKEITIVIITLTTVIMVITNKDQALAL